MRNFCSRTTFRNLFALATVCTASVSGLSAVPIGVDLSSASLPPVGGEYVMTPGSAACFANGAFCLNNLVFSGFGNVVSGFDAMGQNLAFNMSIAGDAVIPGFSGHTVFAGSARMTAFQRYSQSETGTFATEILSLNLVDPFGAMLRVSPALASLGQTSIAQIPGGFHINSFFDIFTELSIDGGQSWIPNDGAPTLPVHLFLTETPEPGSWMLMSAGAGLLGLVRRARVNR